MKRIDAMEYADRMTEERLASLESRIRRIYGQAGREIEEQAAKYYARLEAQDIARRKQVDNGQITEREYREWLRQMMTAGEQYERQRDRMAQRMTDANRLAAEYINGEVPSVFAENRNYTAFDTERGYGDLSFSLYDENTVRRLILEQPDLLPKVDIDESIDIPWNRAKITDTITAAILQGKSIPETAASLRDVADMNRASAVRNARTAITGAQNAGRQDAYAHAASMGIQFRKRWVATFDGRTRDSHRDMDGVTVPYNASFRTPLGSVMLYPGDRAGLPGDVYNCRCTMRSVEKEGIEAEPRMRRARDPATGKNVLIRSMTYRGWEAWKNAKG